MKTLFVSLILLFLFLGCIAMKRAYYDIGLTEVERPLQAEKQYGDQQITRTEEEGVEKYYFEDEMVEIIWAPTSSNISFILTNKTNHSIKIIWDEAAYVDENGTSHRIMHSGVKYTDRNSPQPPSIVVRKGSVEDIIIPTDNVYLSSGKYGGWSSEPLLPHFAMEGSTEDIERKASQYVGKTIQVLLPLKIEETINEYIFSFEIENIEVK